MDPLTAVTLGLGAAQAVGGFFGKRNEAREANKAAARQYAQQLKINYQEQLYANQVYATQVNQYKQQIRSIDEAAALGYSRAQTQRNEALRAASFKTQDRLIQLARNQGQASASGMSGKSAQRLDAGVLASFGRGQAKMAESLLSGSIAMNQDLQDIANQTTSARNQAYSQVAIAPQERPAPIAPTQVQGPSPANLALDLGSVYVGASAQRNSLLAPTDPNKGKLIGFG